jgi:hypothetical protein
VEAAFICMEGNNQLNFTGQINDTITLMKYERSFDINASIYEYLHQNSNLRNVEDKAMCLEYEKYIHFVPEEQQVRCSSLFPLRSKYSSQNPFLKHPQSMLFALCDRPSLTLIQNNWQN